MKGLNHLESMRLRLARYKAKPKRRVSLSWMRVKGRHPKSAGRARIVSKRATIFQIEYPKIETFLKRSKWELKQILDAHRSYTERVERVSKVREAAIRYHEIVYMREIERHTLEEVGQKFGITRERVRQITCAEPKDNE